jgi:hypothetical protein
MSESNNSRIEVEECLRKANSCDANQDRSAWRVLAESWLLLAAINDIVESRKRWRIGQAISKDEFESLVVEMPSARETTGKKPIAVVEN